MSIILLLMCWQTSNGYLVKMVDKRGQTAALYGVNELFMQQIAKEKTHDRGIRLFPCFRFYRFKSVTKGPDFSSTHSTVESDESY